MPAQSYLRTFALAVPSAWTILPQISRFLLKRHFLQKPSLNTLFKIVPPTHSSPSALFPSCISLFYCIEELINFLPNT